MSIEDAVDLIRAGRLQRFNGRWAIGSPIIPGEPMEWFTLNEVDACAADMAEKIVRRADSA